MTNSILPQNRRAFMAAAAAATATATMGAAPARPASAKYVRYNVTSPMGQRMLASYAKGVEAMLNLPAEHPQNWFRNAFIHLMDCPHGNWWFYVWHRGYIGYFEETIRTLSGDPDFTLPYWDWTELPQIPDSMFLGPLTPTAAQFAPTTGNLHLFTQKVKGPMNAYWDQLSADQRHQLALRGYNEFNDLWNDVTGYSPASQAGLSGNMAYAITCGARYLSRDNPKLDPKTAYDCSPHVIQSGLAPRLYWDPNINNSFTSTRTTSHNVQPSGATKFSVLEGLPHNNVHNCIGGVGPVDPGPYGNMTNFLSPVDPIFFLHHANMDRLWDLWTRKQEAMGWPILPTGDDLKSLSEEPFLFYVNGQGRYVGPSVAGQYLSTASFNYTYDQPAPLPPRLKSNRRKTPPLSVSATLDGPAAKLNVPRKAIEAHLADQLDSPLMIQVTLTRPGGASTARSFDVIVNAPEGVTQVEADSPYYAGTVAFFGPVMAHGGHGDHGSSDAVFVVPVPKSPKLLEGLGAAEVAAPLSVRVVPSHSIGRPPPLKAAAVGSY